MNKTKIKATAFILTSFIIGAVILGCGKSTDNDENQVIPDNEQNSTSDITDDTNETKLDYYRDTINSLEDEILALKEQNYVDSREYQLQIEKLEAEIEKLSQSISNPSDDDNSDNTNNPDGNTDIDNIADDKEDPERVFTYKVENGNAVITGYTGKKSNVTVPSEIAGYKVAKIGENAFSSSSVEEITLSQGISELDWFAFAGCYSLKSISVPTSVTSVGYGAFDGCQNTVTIICTKGSYIEAYAASWGMKYVFG